MNSLFPIAGIEKSGNQPGDNHSSDNKNGQRQRCAVLLPLPLPAAYDYAIPAGMRVQDGDWVKISLGGRVLWGCVWGDGGSELALNKLKPILDTTSLPPLSALQRHFIDWVAHYTMALPGMVLKLAMAVPELFAADKAETLWQRSAISLPEMFSMTPARQRVMRVLEDGAAFKLGALARTAESSESVVRGLIKAGLIEPVERVKNRKAISIPNPELPGKPLSAEQLEAVTECRDHIAAGGFGVTVLDGVTGSGKTEIYSEIIADILRSGKQVLVLLPEIALTRFMIDRFTRRFGAEPVLWHSSLSPGRRKKNWRAIAENAAQLVLGARSALFLPYANLGGIIIDEEHETAYKQEEGVLYHARDAAVMRAKMGNIPIMLVSATPSLETLRNIDTGRYEHVKVPHRHGGATLPRAELIDLRKTPPPRGNFIAPPLQSALSECLARGEQSLLFLNRRGYAPLTLCRNCGHRFQCGHCSTWLVLHHRKNSLLCHHCGHHEAVPQSCPECGQDDSLTPCGPGVERIAEETARLFPSARLEILASDQFTTPQALSAALARIEGREVDIVIGTQMIAKGHHFPELTVVGVIDADTGLEGGDPRASERSFQMLQQVAGRAGRGEKPGMVYIQTLLPEIRLMQTLVANDRERFITAEMAMRHRGGLPPFGRLASIILSSEDGQEVEKFGRALARAAPKHDTITILGPAPAPILKIRDRIRWRLLVKTPENIRLQGFISDWLAACPAPRSVEIRVDIDPYSFW